MNSNGFYRRVFCGFFYWLMRFALVMASLIMILPLPPILLSATALSPFADTDYRSGYLTVALTVCKNE